MNPFTRRPAAESLAASSVPRVIVVLVAFAAIFAIVLGIIP